MTSEELRFPSKIDWWVPVFVLASVLAAPVLSTMGAKHTAMTTPVMAVLAISLALPVGLFVWMYGNTSYVIAGDELRITCGPSKETVAIDSISRIRRTISPMSSPALSFQRLEIHYGRFGEVLISPEDQRGFIRAIVARVPNVVLEDLDDIR